MQWGPESQSSAHPARISKSAPFRLRHLPPRCAQGKESLRFPRLRGKLPEGLKGALLILIRLLIFRSPFAAARAGRKCPQDRAHDAREFVARARTCVQRTPPCPREPPQAARHPGCISFGYFSLGKQRKVTRAPDARGKANGRVRRRSRTKQNQDGFPRSRE